MDKEEEDDDEEEEEEDDDEEMEVEEEGEKGEKEGEDGEDEDNENDEDGDGENGEYDNDDDGGASDGSDKENTDCNESSIDLFEVGKESLGIGIGLFVSESQQKEISRHLFIIILSMTFSYLFRKKFGRNRFRCSIRTRGNVFITEFIFTLLLPHRIQLHSKTRVSKKSA